MNDDAALSAVFRVGNGRGFVLEIGSTRYVITAAHCLPKQPPPHGASSLCERTYSELLGRLLDKQLSVWCECLFADPVADIAILGCPDSQELGEEGEAFDA